MSNLGYTFTDCALIIGSLAAAITATTALVTVLIRRRARRVTPHERAIRAMLAGASAADRYQGRLNPARLGIEKQ